MAWTKITKLEEDADAIGWGFNPWGSSQWGDNPGYTFWAKQTKPTDSWTKQTKATL